MTNETTASQPTDFRKVLVAVRESLQFANDSPNGGIDDTIWMMHSSAPETVFDFIDAALDGGPSTPQKTADLFASQPKSIGDDAGFIEAIQAYNRAEASHPRMNAYRSLVSFIDNFRAPAAQASASIQAAPEDERALRAGRNMMDYAKRAGWPDDGEGAFEFLQRTFYEAGAATIQQHVMVAEPVGEVVNVANWRQLLLSDYPTYPMDCVPALMKIKYMEVEISLLRGEIAACRKALAAPMVADPAGVAADQAASVVLTDAQIDAIAEEQEEKYGQLCDADDMRIFARSVISEALKQSSGNSGELAQGEDSARLDAEPGPWVVLVEDADIDYTRLLDVVLSNGVYLMGCKWGELDWTQVRDWRYSGARASAETGWVKS